ncbi:TetR/AcrR family transcriptional regulator [Pelomonas sp. CA6]|uniref:TetR/AcrR family transcriptional regulator n=1 Tax=Pelomonas sp. CA6 TaxID=2907999 RepID=UPI001F4BDFA3|nr:TetR/AcrR family transcriptional regulator [Pelomonas sp. CA6]MCH7345451.1 TetR/AcrR family transcriptional regulator [Pelomonas sp. CA6]
MRTSKTQQARNRRQILDAAVRLMEAQGFEATTMKQVAREAGLGDATIYNYFPSKEKLVLGYFEQAFEDALAQWRATPEQAEFSLQERLQLLLDCLLERLAPQRGFVALARRALLAAPLTLLGEELPGKPAFRAAVEQMLDEAEARGEMPYCGFKAALGALVADYAYGVIGFWLHDDSEQQGETTRLLDQSLELLVLVLRTGLVSRLLALAGLLLRSQMARLLRPGSGLLDMLGLLRQGLGEMPASAPPTEAPPPAAPARRARKATPAAAVPARRRARSGA